jgi:hypothetical protein
MYLNDLLRKHDIDARQVLVFRHRPYEPELRKVLPWLAAERPKTFNAYQQTQGERVEKALQTVKYAASFIGHRPNKALYVGLYKIQGWRRIDRKQFWKIPEHIEMSKFGMEGFTKAEKRQSKLWFELKELDFYSAWKGRLVVDWPKPEISWWRRADRNAIAVSAVLEESALVPKMPDWERLVLGWQELNALPSSWKHSLAHWRGIYFIFDRSDCKGYVGSAYGEEHLLGRWLQYGRTGHGGNKRLCMRSPENFHFAILQLVSPSLAPADVIAIENSWKERLQTRYPLGLNDN